MADLSAHRTIGVTTPLGDDVLLLSRMMATEQLGRLFQFELELLSGDERIAMDEVLGQDMTVKLELPGNKQRHFHGFVSRFSQTGRAGGFATYHATLRPWLWFLTRTADCRIFQETTVPDIIKQVFRDRGFSDFEERLSGTYRTWEYCVQYRETDFNFISRLMEQEGIYYFFTHDEGKHTLVLSDSISAHEPILGYEKVPYYPPSENVVREEHIFDWRISQQVQPVTYVVNDYNFKDPKDELTAQAKIPRKHARAEYEIYDYPGEYPEYDDGESYARTRIEELQAEYERVEGESDARGLQVGGLFNLTESPREDQNREYLIVSARYEMEAEAFESGGSGGATYTCSFEAMDSRQPYRPPRTTPKPVVQGPQTAVVVGKSGEEIWPDKYGRVKVQFHWDRYGKLDENSSCWIRVAQVWAGKRWGGIHIPRIGHEVIVEFLEGDPDRPIVTGRVYNGDNKPPYPLPENATMSTVKSNSSKGGEGFNEVRFEDKKGEEQLFVHAEKDQDLRVKNDRREWIGHERHLIVKDNKFEEVDGDRSEKVKGSHKEEIGGDRNLLVSGEERKEVTGKLSLIVDGSAGEEFGGDHSETTGGQATIQATDIVLDASSNISLVVGGSSIAIEAGGITLKTSGDIELDASGKVIVKGLGGVDVDSPAQVTVKGTTVSVKGSAMTEIQGALVKIN